MNIVLILSNNLRNACKGIWKKSYQNNRIFEDGQNTAFTIIDIAALAVIAVTVGPRAPENIQPVSDGLNLEDVFRLLYSTIKYV